MHVQDGDDHAVLVESLRVLVNRDGKHWFAQGLEIDYAASGDSLEDVKRRFTDGLCLTIAQHVKVFGGLQNLLKIAPADEWQRLLQRDIKRYKLTVGTVFGLADEDLPEDLPFDQIQFYEPREERAA